MPANPLLITIDGPAGSGKTTIAHDLAQILDIGYLDTGAMFRGIALHLGEDSWNLQVDVLRSRLSKIKFQLNGSGPNSQLILNKSALSSEIRNEKVGIWASYLGQNPIVREFLKKMQREIGSSTSLVTEGRDMGTVVFPDATHKFFLDADTRERARRRWEQLRGCGKNPNYEEILEKLQQRDAQDRNREFAPLKPASDAVRIDTSGLEKEKVFSSILQYIDSR